MSRQQWSRKLQGAEARISPLLERDGTSYGRTGSIRTPLGVVAVTIYYPAEKYPGSTTYETVVGGVLFDLREEVDRSNTGAAIIAHRWIRDLHGQAGAE